MPETDDDRARTEARGGESVRRWQTDVVATLLLGLAAVGAGWAAYQSAVWNSDALFTLDRADVLRRQAGFVENRGILRRVVDVGLFTAYLQALDQHNNAFAQFLFQRLRAPLKAATAAWLATRPLQNPGAPPTPFVMKEYQLPEDGETQRLNNEGEQILLRAREENKRADQYVLVTVPFAVASLFAGISSKFRPPGIQRAIVAMGLLAFAGAVLALTLLPVA